MQLSEILEYLMYGELANLAIGSDEEGHIREKDIPKVISNINLAMIDIYKRYPVLVKLINIQMYEHISMYQLHSKYAARNFNSVEPYKYLIDSVFYPFNDDVIKILGVVNEGGTPYPLNVENDELSVFTPAYNIIQVPYPINENKIQVEYQAYPAKIPSDTTDLTLEVNLPEFLLEPLISYVNYKLLTRVGVDKPESINYLKKYELEMNRINDLGVFNSDSRINLKLELNQWA